MTISQILEKMIVNSQGNRHDIHHFIHVWTYARTIAELEGLEEKARFVLEAAAIVHDIACPLCREKYKSTDGRLQEQEGPALTEAFFAGTDMPQEQVKRVAFLVGHHHTCTGIDGLDWQILVEADYIANAEENQYPREQVRCFLQEVMKTASGRRLCREITGIREETEDEAGNH